MLFFSDNFLKYIWKKSKFGGKPPLISHFGEEKDSFTASGIPPGRASGKKVFSLKLFLKKILVILQIYTYFHLWWIMIMMVYGHTIFRHQYMSCQSTWYCFVEPFPAIGFQLPSKQLPLRPPAECTLWQPTRSLLTSRNVTRRHSWTLDSPFREKVSRPSIITVAAWPWGHRLLVLQASVQMSRSPSSPWHQNDAGDPQCHQLHGWRCPQQYFDFPLQTYSNSIWHRGFVSSSCLMTLLRVRVFPFSTPQKCRSGAA